jgi:hypothetical protein
MSKFEKETITAEDVGVLPVKRARAPDFWGQISVANGEIPQAVRVRAVAMEQDFIKDGANITRITPCVGEDYHIFVVEGWRGGVTDWFEIPDAVPGLIYSDTETIE